MQSPHQLDMKNIVEWWKDFFLYFNILETYRDLAAQFSPKLFAYVREDSYIFEKICEFWGNLLHHHISVDFLLAFVVHPLLAYFVPKLV